MPWCAGLREDHGRSGFRGRSGTSGGTFFSTEAGSSTIILLLVVLVSEYGLGGARWAGEAAGAGPDWAAGGGRRGRGRTGRREGGAVRPRSSGSGAAHPLIRRSLDPADGLRRTRGFLIGPGDPFTLLHRS